MYSAITMVTLAIASFAPTTLTAPAESAPQQVPPSYYYYQPEVAHHNYQQTRSAEFAAYAPAQSAPASRYRAPSAYYYQSPVAPDSYLQAGSANPPSVYAQPPSSKSYSRSSIQKRPLHHLQQSPLVAQQVKKSPGKRPYYYKAWHYY